MCVGGYVAVRGIVLEGGVKQPGRHSAAVTSDYS